MGRGGKPRKRLVLATLGVVGALVFAGCDWPMFAFDVAHTGSSPDKAINSANVSTVQPLFTVPAQSDPFIPGQFGPPVVSNGVVYAGSSSAGNTSGNLEAFDANGATNCSGSPNQCSPLWTGSTGPIIGSAPAVANGVVYIASTESTASTIPPTLYAFDAGGVTNCSGTPKVCQPLWTAPLSTGDIHVEPPNVTNGVVYVSGYQSPGGIPPQGPTGTVQAFDAAGVTNCSGTPKVCQPLWTTAANIGYSAPAVANGVLYAIGEDTLDAFSANGTTNCSGSPTTCAPLWTATLDTSPSFVSTVSPAVSSGVVYAQSGNFNLDAFSANGTTNCSGAPKTCTPLWTATNAGLDAVANGIVYGETTSNNQLSAFDAGGVTNCSGTPKVCQPLWSYSLTGPVGPVSVANGLVFYASSFCAAACSSDPGFDFEAFDASGVTKCSGTPKVCQPLWTGLEASSQTGSAAIANGKVYVGEGFSNPPNGGHLEAWVLPPPTTYVAIPSNNATVSGAQLLDAGASPGVTQVQYEVSGGTLNHSVIATATPTYYGWLANWNTTTVPNGTYALQSVASYGGEVSGTSTPITVTVQN
jgi:PQQ-like domain